MSGTITPHGGSSTARTSAQRGQGNAHGNPQPHGGPQGTTSTTHGNGPKSKGTTDSGATTTNPSASTSSTTTTNPTPTAPPLNPIAQKISNNHGLLPKVTAMLPKGMSLDQATMGFKSQGQAIAALHASQNHGIPFADLKTAMTGITPIVGPVPPAPTGTSPTGTSPTTTPTSPPPQLLSLGQAINKLSKQPVDSTTAATTAEHQASTDLAGASTPPKPAPKTTATATTR